MSSRCFHSERQFFLRDFTKAPENSRHTTSTRSTSNAFEQSLGNEGRFPPTSSPRTHVGRWGLHYESQEEPGCASLRNLSGRRGRSPPPDRHQDLPTGPGRGAPDPRRVRPQRRVGRVGRDQPRRGHRSAVVCASARARCLAAGWPLAAPPCAANRSPADDGGHSRPAPS